MDQSQRDQFRTQVIRAMEAKSWSATKTAEVAGITQTTMTRVTNAQSVQRGTVGKLRAALDILALAPAQDAAGYSQDVELIRDAVGMWLRDVSPEKRAAKVEALFASIASVSKGSDD